MRAVRDLVTVTSRFEPLAMLDSESDARVFVGPGPGRWMTGATRWDLAATLAAHRVDTSRDQPTPSEQHPRSQTQIDTDRQDEPTYGSEGWGFEFLRAR
jgi:hypothetical protein